MPTIIQSDPRAREKPCLRCGYSLRKLADSRNCPECGLAIWISLSNNDTFDLSNPDWIRRLRNGCAIMAGAQLAAMLVALVGSAVDPFGRSGAALLEMVCIAAYAAGLLLVAWHEHRYPDKLKVHRRTALFLAGLACIGAALAMPFWGPGPRAVAADVALLGCALAPWPLLRRLLQRVPNPRLARLAGAILLLPASSLLLLFPAVGYIVLFEFPWIIVVVLWIYLVASLLLLARSAYVFHRTIPEAENNWSQKG